MNPTIDEAIRKTVDAVQTVAPKAWELAVEYQRVDGLVCAVREACLTVVLVIVYVVFWKKCSYEKKQFERSLYRVMATAFFLVIGIGVCGGLIHDIARTRFPQVYAADYLMRKSR